MSQQPLNPIKVTAQAGDRENWATARTRHLANHPPEEKDRLSTRLCEKKGFFKRFDFQKKRFLQQKKRFSVPNG